MPWGRGQAGLFGAAMGLALLAGHMAAAQEVAPPPRPARPDAAAPVVETPPAQAVQPAASAPRFLSQLATVQQDQLFARTLYGRAVQARTEEASRALQEENRRIEADLEAEERGLTTRRATLPADQFRALADAFDVKVEGIRDAQEAKGRALARQAEENRQRFFQTAVPVLAELMSDIGAVALLDKSNIILSLDAIDITDRAVTRIDAVLGDGSSLPAPAPAPAAPVDPAAAP
ncbi:OmpH family outer membrane protein [Gemmobacter fulvus]|uniref:OmpH family outer membrane protein n=1 Tax=Gemmobacter fulvus TaxID=2840474 RepID=A0A975S273_9RHOB|nr:OmpH family outer membrane protein [Gemmobacter fulvus]MBT9243895.1 OmpH family outer membrane protein [Gemmobacter fulvus]QWK90815.1 OmpH family outer membrane protein [Gemmobacter fulvus]